MIKGLSLKRIHIDNEDQAIKYGEELGRTLSSGSLLALIGDLGVGKTTLTKGIAKGLGIGALIKSPTFNILKEYSGGRLPLYHFDVYRLAGSDELEEIGYEDYFYGSGITVVEWADKVEDLLPEDSIIVKMYYDKEDEEGRIYEIE